MILHRIGVFSCAKLFGVVYAALGLIAGFFVSVFSALGFLANSGDLASETGVAAFGFLFGLGAVILMPVFYGLMGFIGGVMSALIYNVASRVVGGMRLELVAQPATASPGLSWSAPAPPVAG